MDIDVYPMNITSTGKVIIDGKLIGDFKSIQENIYKKNPEIIRKHRVKALYLGQDKIRFIANWEQIINEFQDTEIYRRPKEGASGGNQKNSG